MKKRRQLGFTCHPCMGMMIAVVFACVMGAQLAVDLGKSPGAPEGWLGWTLLGTGFVLYLVAGFATQEMMLFLGLLGLGVPWGVWSALEAADVVAPVAAASGRWAWYVLYAYALTPVFLAGAFFLWLWIRSRRE